MQQKKNEAVGEAFFLLHSSPGLARLQLCAKKQIRRTAKTKNGKFIYERTEVAKEFFCERCKKTKNAKITVKWINFENEKK